MYERYQVSSSDDHLHKFIVESQPVEQSNSPPLQWLYNIANRIGHWSLSTTEEHTERLVWSLKYETLYHYRT